MHYTNKIPIVVASNANYVTKTFKALVHNLTTFGFSPEDIYFYVSGTDNTGGFKKTNQLNGINMVFLPYNSFEVTPLIDIACNGFSHERFFLIHDTCLVGKRFKAKIEKNPIARDLVYISDSVSMNMGIYTTTLIQSYKNHILQYYNEDLSSAALKNIKDKIIRCPGGDDILRSVVEPSQIASMGAKKQIIQNPDLDIECPVNISNKIDYQVKNRMIEYYSEIDLIKIKGNWSPKEKSFYTITI